jgi:hypothetical protein
LSALGPIWKQPLAAGLLRSLDEWLGMLNMDRRSCGSGKRVVSYQEPRERCHHALPL